MWTTHLRRTFVLYGCVYTIAQVAHAQQVITLLDTQHVYYGAVVCICHHVGWEGTGIALW